MAVNPPLNDRGAPLAAAGEVFLLSRTGMGFKCEVPGVGTLKGDGHMYMTSRRLCFISHKPKKTGSITLNAFDVPYTHLSGEKFEQPIFGANYLAGIVAPIPGMGLAAPGKFRLVFNDGGVGTFLRLFFTIMDQTRRSGASVSAAAAGAAASSPFPPAFAEQVRSGAFQRAQQAYVDPADPSVLFIAQPDFVTYAPASSTPASSGGATPVAVDSSDAGYVHPAVAAAAAAGGAAAGGGAYAAYGAGAGAGAGAGSGYGAGAADGSTPPAAATASSTGAGMAPPPGISARPGVAPPPGIGAATSVGAPPGSWSSASASSGAVAPPPGISRRPGDDPSKGVAL